MAMILKAFTRALRRLVDRFAPPRRLRIIEGDSLPSTLPCRDVILAREGGEDWCVGLRCPCGCGRRIELLVVVEAKPRWDVVADSKHRVTLNPSVWINDGCKSHFILRAGRIHWCE
jgi:hypothetical protein